MLLLCKHQSQHVKMIYCIPIFFDHSTAAHLVQLLTNGWMGGETGIYQNQSFLSELQIYKNHITLTV